MAGVALVEAGAAPDMLVPRSAGSAEPAGAVAAAPQDHAAFLPPVKWDRRVLAGPRKDSSELRGDRDIQSA
jgi:hypothetical protein